MSNLRTVRTYGGWTVPRSEGMFGLTGPMTYSFLGWIIGVILSFAIFGVWAALLILVAGFVVGVALIIRPQGRTLYEWVYLAMAFHRAKKKGKTTYRSGPFSAIPGGNYKLPGALSKFEMFEGTTVGAQPFGMIYNPGAGEYTIVFRVWPQGDELVDGDTADAWVDMWGAFLANLGNEGDIAGAVATIETFPDTGVTVRSEVASLVHDDAPYLAQEILVQAAEQQSTQGLDFEARMSLTFRPSTSKRSDPLEMSTEIGRRIPILQKKMGAAGLRSEAMNPDEIIRFVKRAYDPSTQLDVELADTTAEGHQISWDDAGPAAASQSVNYYNHDGAISTTWEMREPPRGYVTSGILAGLVSKTPDITRKRVSVIYRPHTAGEAASIVDKDAIDARQGTKQERQRKGVASARKEQREVAAEIARQAEALGHGLSRFGVLITVTVPAPDSASDKNMFRESELPNVEAIVKSLTQQARLTIRRRFANQQFSFGAGLGIGLLIPEHQDAATMVQG